MRASTAGLHNRGEASDARANQCFVGTATRPRHAASAAADLLAAHSALGGAVLAIGGVRTYAHAISTGAVAVFRAFRRAQLR